MKIKSVQRKNVATVPSAYSGQERRFAQSVSEELDTLSGRRGNVIDRAVTFRDLITTNVLRASGGIIGGGDVDVINPNDPNGSDSGPTELPTKPTNLTATQGSFDQITLTWALAPYNGHGYVEIFRHSTNSLVAAQSAGVYTRYYGDTYFYTDRNVASGETWYYWVRAVNVDGIVGPFNATSGTAGSTATDYIYVSDLIDDILDDDVNSLGLNTTLDGQQSAIDLTNTKFSVKIDNNSHVSGFGLISTSNNATVTSAFIVASDRFAISAPFNASSSANTAVGEKYPFKVLTTATVINGESIPAGVYIEDAFIHNAQITGTNIKTATITNAHITDLTATKITSGNIQITAANDIKIYQGKTNFNSNSSGFWLGLHNSSGSFHVGANSTKYLKFEGATGDLETSGLVVKAPDQTVLLDAGGSYTGSGGNLAFNGNFALKSSGNNPKGWTLWQGTGTFGSNFVRITSNGGNVRQNSQRFPVVNGETLYVYCQTNVYAGSSLQVSYYSADTGTSGFVQTQTVSHSAGTLNFTTVTGGNGASRGFGVAAVTVPSNLNAKFAELRMTCTNSAGVYYFNVGISRTPPVIDSSYASTYIRDLSVDTLQIAGNAVTLADSSSTPSFVGSGSSYTTHSLETGLLPENSAIVWFVNAIVNDDNNNPNQYDLVIKIYTKTTSGSYVLKSTRLIWIYSYGLDSRIIKEAFPASHSGDGYMKCEVRLQRHNQSTLVNSGGIEISYVGAKK